MPGLTVFGRAFRSMDTAIGSCTHVRNLFELLMQRLVNWLRHRTYARLLGILGVANLTEMPELTDFIECCDLCQTLATGCCRIFCAPLPNCLVTALRKVAIFL